MSVSKRRVQGGEASSDIVVSAHVGGNAEVFPKILKLHVPAGAKISLGGMTMADDDKPLDPEVTAWMVATIVRLSELLDITIEDAASIFLKVSKVFDPTTLRKVQ